MEEGSEKGENSLYGWCGVYIFTIFEGVSGGEQCAADDYELTDLHHMML